ncbi:MAG: CPBP family intramembrane metalloprotease [Acaryochloris sp. RU_4_1]|nr:CPBP family intramembrane metalloprotease [Acaryochloris sp. SU_5_25]NJM66284.1 CPBP family intramembrane metalloprotease [Acaryochloris sp. RU_4_1]NJR56220.1 CPBP family intramembrane metalloprotease [Acaryochloris sp. CRU_2_0]
MNHSFSSSQLAFVPKSLLGQFLQFLRRPRYTVNVPTDHQGIVDILRLYPLALLIVLPLGVISAMIAANLQSSNAVEDLAKTMSVVEILILVVGVAPLWEEAVFRLPLRYTPSNLAIPISLGMILVVLMFVGKDLSKAVFLAFLGVVMVLGVALRFWLKEKVGSKTIHRFYEKWIGWLFYGLAISFGLVHLSNFTSLAGQAWLLAPLLVLPQTALGIFLGFIRLRYGFWWSVLTHAFHNACALTPLMLMRLGSDNLRSSMAAGVEAKNLASTDYLILLVLMVFMFGGLLLCLITVWRLIAEWRSEEQQSQV